MKKLGTYFGVDILADTDDEMVFKRMESHLAQTFKLAYPLKTDDELHEEVMRNLNASKTE